MRPGDATMLRLAIVTNIPAPYRVPVYNRLAREPGIDLHVYYAALIEADRRWDLPAFEHAHTFMDGRVYERAGRYIHYTPGVVRQLGSFSPHVVVTTGFNPTHLAAWWYALRQRRAHVVMTDGTDASEAGLSVAHRAIRHIVFARTQAFLVASAGGRRLLRSYGVDAERVHVSPLCANTSVGWAAAPGTERDIDLLFSGRLVPIKNASFALQVAAAAAARLGRPLRVAMLGSGPDEVALRQQAATLQGQVDVQFAGHVTQAEVPHWFQRSRLFLFPTRWDPWGVVANEACLAGVPALVSPHAGVAGELVLDGVNGRVLPLVLDTWVDATVQLLADDELRQRYALAAEAAVAPYSFENAALGIADAARQAVAGAVVPARRSTFR
jgi:glycosyltransferase involved in cell wall biosynthesis